MKSSLSPSCPGLFIVGSDTGVGKTHVAAQIVADLFAQGVKVGVYKPAASGCKRVKGKLVSADAVALWKGAGQPGLFEAVCPQAFAAPLAPHLAAKAEKKRLDPLLLRQGLEYWRKESELVVVEGAGGLLSPLGEDENVADLAAEFGFPLLIVVPNRIGLVNQALLTIHAAQTYHRRLTIAGVVICDIHSPQKADPSIASNPAELALRSTVPILTRLRYKAKSFDDPIDWQAVATS